MPKRIMMNLNPRAPTQSQIASFLANQSNIAPLPISATSPLNSPMIGRIHNAIPGCSSCGRK